MDKDLCESNSESESSRQKIKDHIGKSVFVTVGTTRFDQLVDTVLPAQSKEATDHLPQSIQHASEEQDQDIHSVLVDMGYSSMTVQFGNRGGCRDFSKMSSSSSSSSSALAIQAYNFKPSLHEDMKKADLIISHAGSGSILESLRLNKKLVVVPNTELMNNHQRELCDELEKQGVLLVATCATLPNVLKNLTKTEFKKFPDHQITLFPTLLDSISDGSYFR